MEQEPIWVHHAIVTAIHKRQIEAHGGVGGIRDAGLLASAVTKPINLFHYSDPKPSLAELAAAYACGIVFNHPFVDGNKRAAYVTCRLFLVLNNKDIHASQASKYNTFVKLASGKISQAELALWIKIHLQEKASS